jgi:hypothetical protein
MGKEMHIRIWRMRRADEPVKETKDVGGWGDVKRTKKSFLESLTSAKWIVDQGVDGVMALVFLDDRWIRVSGLYPPVMDCREGKRAQGETADSSNPTPTPTKRSGAAVSGGRKRDETRGVCWLAGTD